MDEAETRARGGSWAFRHLEGVMMGAARPPRDGEDGVTRVTSSFDDDDEWYQHKPTLMAGHAGDSETDDERADAAESVAARAGDAGPFTPRSARFTLSAEEEDFSVSRSVPERDEASSTNRRGGWASWLRAAVPTWARAGLGARGWAAREKVRRRVAARRGWERAARRRSEHPEKKETDSPARDGRAGAASWITDDDVETFFLSEPDPLGVGAFFHGVGTWAANRRERARAAAAAAAPPLLQVVRLTDADRERLRLGCDEMHFLPVPDSGWSVALLRYTPASNVTHFPPSRRRASPPRTPCGTTRIRARRRRDPREKTADGARSGVRVQRVHVRRRAVFLAGARARARGPRRVRGGVPRRGLLAPVAVAGRVGGPEDERAQAARAHVRDFDYDTYLREDLPAACGYVAAVTGEERLGAVGHSMGGMLGEPRLGRGAGGADAAAGGICRRA